MNNSWLDIELLEDYLDGKLDSKAMHRIEKQALEDPFVAQALSGLSESKGRATQSFSLLQKQLYERIAQQQVTKKETVFTWQRLSVASAAAVMFIAISIFFFMRERLNRQQLTKSQLRRVEVNMAPAPSVVPSVSMPVGGWANLDSYLTDHNKFKNTKSGKSVALSFLIDAEGKPSDIKVLKGAATELDKEAIRLIKEGPKWEQPKSADARVSYTVAF